MKNNTETYIPIETNLRELTVRGIILSILLAIVLALANSYLALKAGLLTSASIPAAVISMGILRFFRDSNVLENNLVQTAASAGEAVAGGIVYTIPALIIIHYWADFPYWQCVSVAMLGGLMGVLFSIPMRRVLVNEPSLRFPEGRAIAEVLKMADDSTSHFRFVLAGGLLGALIELGQTGFKFLTQTWQLWFVAGRSLFGFGAGFSAAMIGAGYLVGTHIALSIFAGAVIGWLLGVPILSEIYPQTGEGLSPTLLVMSLWESKLRYLGIGAMLAAGVWTFLTLLRPFATSIRLSMQAIRSNHKQALGVVRTDKDVPFKWVILGLGICGILLYYFFMQHLPTGQLGFGSHWAMSLVWACLGYVFVVGLVFSAVTAYFSGLVGVTASPGSAIIIAGMLMLGVMLLTLMQKILGHYDHSQLLAAEAITVFCGALITGAAAISNDNIQDLKVGHILGATPWKQQIMLMLGVVTAALVIPPVMQLLFEVYGIAGVMPRPDMDPMQSLPAPPAALLAAITQAIFQQNLPWDMFFAGIGLVIVLIILNQWRFNFSVLGVAIGIYLPLGTSIPIFIGGMMAYVANHGPSPNKQRGVLIACGMVAGAALMDVVLAIPFSIYNSPNVLSLVGSDWELTGAILATLCTLGLGYGFYRVVNSHD